MTIGQSVIWYKASNFDQHEVVEIVGIGLKDINDSAFDVYIIETANGDLLKAWAKDLGWSDEN